MRSKNDSIRVIKGKSVMGLERGKTEEVGWCPIGKDSDCCVKKLRHYYPGNGKPLEVFT